jgi:hypothetical protein
MPSKTHKPKYVKIDFDLAHGPLSVYASPKILTALKEVTADLTLYHGVRLMEILGAVYQQGLKDGRRDVVTQIESMKTNLNYLPPGRPKKSKR